MDLTELRDDTLRAIQAADAQNFEGTSKALKAILADLDNLTGNDQTPASQDKPATKIVLLEKPTNMMSFLLTIC